MWPLDLQKQRGSEPAPLTGEQKYPVKSMHLDAGLQGPGNALQIIRPHPPSQESNAKATPEVFKVAASLVEANQLK
jgi:hypothetical protein